jgi:hypothetical protein
MHDQVSSVVFFTAGWASAIGLTEDIIPKIHRVEMRPFWKKANDAKTGR